MNRQDHVHEKDRQTVSSQTKAIIPGTSPLLISRPRLMNLLTRGIEKRLLLLSAPPGYGKTTSLVQFFSSFGGPFAWHSVGQHDITLRTCAEELSSQMANLSSDKAMEIPPGAHAPADFGRLLAKYAAQALPDGVHLVVDGLDRSPALKDLEAMLSALLHFAPPTLHMVLSTTARLRMNISLLARKGQLARIGRSELTFTMEETEQVLANHWGRESSRRLAGEVFRMSGGRPTSVGLMLLAWRSPPPESHPLLGGVLWAAPDTLESMAAWEKEAISLMTVLDKFDAKLLAALTGHRASESIIEDLLERIALVTRSSDGEHSLVPSVRDHFLEMIEDQLSEEKVSAVRRSAAGILGNAGRLKPALDLYLASADMHGASDILDRIGIWEAYMQDPAVIISWGEKLDKAHELGAAAHVVCGERARLSGDISRSVRHLQTALEKGGSDMGVRERITILPNLYVGLRMTGGAGAAKIREELFSLEPGSPEISGYHHQVLGSLLGLESKLAAGARELRTAASLFKQLNQHDAYARAMNRLAAIEIKQGDYHSALCTLIEISSSGNRLDMANEAHMFGLFAELHGFMGAFDVAEARMREALEISGGAGMKLAEFSQMLGCAELAIWQGRPDKANIWIERAGTKKLETNAGSDYTDALLDYHKAYLAWTVGEHRKAESLFRKFLDSEALAAVESFQSMWWELQAAFAFLRMSSSSEAKKMVQGVLERAKMAESRHIVSNAILILAYMEAKEGNHRQSAQYRHAVLKMAGDFGYTFMPVSDLSLLEWSGTELLAAPFVDKYLRAIDGSMDGAMERQTESRAQKLEVGTLGRLEFVLNGRVLDDALWYGKGKARRLLELLLSHDSLSCSKDEIIDQLWPNAASVRGRQRLYTVVSDLRRVFRKGRLNNQMELKFEYGFYRLILCRGVTLAHVEYRQMADKAKSLMATGATGEAERSLRQAIAMYRDDFLMDALYESFTDQQRENLRELQTWCLCSMATLAGDDHFQALKWWNRALDHDPYHEEAYKGFIYAAQALGLRKKALAGFERMEKTLGEELGISLPTWAEKMRNKLFGHS